MPTFLWSLVFLLLLTCGRAGAKAHIHVVLARYDEDVSWIQDYAQRTDVKFIVYNKGEPLTGSVQSSQNVDIIPIRNLGLEAGTYLHHIVHNYDNLAELTVFLQAAEPTHIPPGHLYPGVTFEDYLKKPLYVPTILVTADMKEVSYRKGYHGFGPVEASFNPCPADGLDRWFNFGPFSYWDIVQGRRIKEQSAEFPTLESMWSSLLPRIPYPKHAIAMSHGAQFSVSRQNIVQHPLEFYQRLWDANQKSSESYTAFYLEYMWWYIFFFDTEHQSPCSLDTAALASHPRWDMSHPELPKWVRMQEQAYGTQATFCFDGIQNGDETGIDCGGSCGFCQGTLAQLQTDADVEACIDFDPGVLTTFPECSSEAVALEAAGCYEELCDTVPVWHCPDDVEPETIEAICGDMLREVSDTRV